MFSGYHQTGEKAVQTVPEVHKKIAFRNPQPGFPNLRTSKVYGLIGSFTRKASRQRVRKLTKCLSELPGKTAETVIKNLNVSD